jgi:hypothetical protein
MTLLAWLIPFYLQNLSHADCFILVSFHALTVSRYGDGRQLTIIFIRLNNDTSGSCCAPDITQGCFQSSQLFRRDLDMQRFKFSANGESMFRFVATNLSQ